MGGDGGSGEDPTQPEGCEPTTIIEGLTCTLIPFRFSALSGSFRWTLRGILSTPGHLPEKIYSDPFEVGGIPWRVLLYPNGNGLNSLALYLDLANAMALPPGWSRLVNFSFAVRNTDPSLTVVCQSEKSFFAGVQDWGFRECVPLPVLYDPSEGFLVDDVLEIEVAVTLAPSPDSDADSENGVDPSTAPMGRPQAGLTNQGATCYLNSLLQLLFALTHFRQKVYETPVGDVHDAVEDDDAVIPRDPDQLRPPTAVGDHGRLVHCLQQVFFNLQFLPKPVSTRELTASFGWTTEDAFRQHDIHELTRVLCSSLEERMKGTHAAGVLDSLFRGVMVHVVTARDVDYTSRVEEPFYDVQLNVKGCPTVAHALQQYIDPETLSGDNAYHVPSHGPQTVDRRTIFTKLPPVLMLHLKRFQFNMTTGRQSKINDQQHFPTSLDMAPYVEGGRDPAANHEYQLFGVLVHSGDVHCGHYYVFLQPGFGGAWYRYDDERVIQVSEQDAVAENFGGEYGGGHLPRYASAYMLVYVRKEDSKWVVGEQGPGDVPARIFARFGKSARRGLYQGAATAHLLVAINVVVDAELVGKKDFEGIPLPPPSAASIRIPRRNPFSHLLAAVKEAYGEGELWVLVERLNGTWRPSKALQCGDPEMTVEQVLQLGAHDIEAVPLFVEQCGGQVYGGSGNTDCILMLIKFYDGDTLRYLGARRFGLRMTVRELWEAVRQTWHLDAVDTVTVYEEVRNGMLDTLPMGDMSCSELELEDGDILVFSIAEASPSAQQYVRNMCSMVQ
eukprot:Sspe_Gene.33002::Locus_16150_Transcript_1_1_Confidence_1.000_Length_2446::g.33002::m.33002/K11838/USP7, UBP15; ubiquitin carboxyl-terminal hydrolase 7